MKESTKQRLRKRVQQEEIRSLGGTPEEASFHRRAYHRNFEGYTEVKQLNAQGKTVIQRIYTGKYYEPELDMKHRLTLRFFYLVFFISGTALFLYCSTRSFFCNTVIYVNLFQAICIPLLLWCIYVLAFYLPSTGKLTIGEYNTEHRSLLSAARLTACCMWCTAAAALLCGILNFRTQSLSMLLCVPGFAAAGLLIFLIYLFENMLKYTIIENDASAPPEGMEIE